MGHQTFSNLVVPRLQFTKVAHFELLESNLRCHDVVKMNNSTILCTIEKEKKCYQLNQVFSLL